jgi:hypothetical protein
MGIIVMVFNSNKWDFANTDWRLNTSIYKSSPSSLEFTGQNGALCKDDNAMGINMGKLGTWIRIPYSDYRPGVNIHFRCNDAPGSFNIGSAGVASYGWTLMISTGGWKPFYGSYYWQGYYVEGRDTLFNVPNLQDWHYVEVLWWVSSGVLIVRVLLDGIKLYNDLTDSLNRGNGNRGRVGVGGYISYSGFNPFFDDTSIYKALEG